MANDKVGAKNGIEEYSLEDPVLVKIFGGCGRCGPDGRRVRLSRVRWPQGHLRGALRLHEFGRCSSIRSLEIRISGLRYATGGVEILKGIDTDVPREDITAVVGPSGAGKSTLLRAINRLIEPTAGEVYLDGEPTSAMNPLELRRRVGMVFQLPALFGTTVEEAILYGADLAGRSAEARRLLEMVGLAASFIDSAPEGLSVGEQQRVSIARALALESQALLIDEPTSALDEAARRRIEDLVQELNASLGLTIVLVSHDLEQVERIADRVVLLVGGRSEGELSREEFFSGPGERARRHISGRS